MREHFAAPHSLLVVVRFTVPNQMWQFPGMLFFFAVGMLGSGLGIVVVFQFPGNLSLFPEKSQYGATALLLGRRPDHLAHVREALEVVRLRRGRGRARRHHLRRWVMLRRRRRRRRDRLLLGRGRHRGAAPVPRGRRRLAFV